MTNTPGMSIGQLAKQANVTSRTLRYYEELGLIAPKTRGENRYRYYDDSHVLRLATIKLLRELGFGLKDIVAALAPLLDPSGQITPTGQEMSRQIADALATQKLQLLQKQADIQQALKGIDATVKSLAACSGCENSRQLSDCAGCECGPKEVVQIAQQMRNDLDAEPPYRKIQGAQ